LRPPLKTISAIFGGLLGIGGTTAVNTGVLDGLFHDHDEFSRIDHTHAPVTPIVAEEEFQAISEGVLHSCRKIE